jgi:two-component system, cell cycle sensor histidine kinase and response regulator CckA
MDPLRRLRPVSGPVIAAACGCGLLALALWPGGAGFVAAALGSALGLAGGLSRVLTGPAPPAVLDALAEALHADPDTLIVTDGAGSSLPWPGQPADPGALQTQLAPWCADPDQVIRSTLADLRKATSARRDFQRGPSALRLGVHVVDRSPAGGSPQVRILWRLSRIDRASRRGLDALGLPVLTISAIGDQPVGNPALIRLLDAPEHPEPARRTAVPPDAAAERGPLAPVLSQLTPLLERTAEEVALRMPGGQTVLARIFPARDGQRDILFFPAGLAPGGTFAAPGPQDYEDIPVALIQLDGDGTIYGTNRAARSLMGLSPAEDRPLWEVVEGLGRPVSDWLEDARAGRALNRPEVLRATCASGETYVQIILRRASPASPPGALVAVVSDATELKSLEARFVQSQKMQAIGQLAGGIAHDFNNLLTAISGHCDLLLLGLDPYDPDYNDLLQIHQNANRAAALVRQLLAFSRKQTLQPEILTLDDLLEDVVHLLTRLVGERIQLRLVHDPQVGAIRADRRQLEQVIVNLVVNARDAMPMGGEIRIESHAVTLTGETEIGRARLPAGHYARLQVIDTGVGIPPDLIEKIFEPFFTTKRQGEGTGLGLSTAYGIVKQMGGYIFVDSLEGSGTTFSIYFASDPTHASETRLSTTPVPARAGARKSALSRALTAPGAPPAASVRFAPGAESGHMDDRPEGLRAETPPGPPPAPAGTDAPVQGPTSASTPPGLARRAPVSDPGSGSGSGPRARANATSGVPRRLNSPQTPDGLAPGADIAGIVLLVEDEAPVRAFAARALRLKGYRVLEAEDGEQALEVLADPGLAVDIFVSDVIMPGRDGPAWVAEALAARPGTPVVFMSGYIEDTLTEALSRTPQAVFLEKPFSLDQLCSTIGAQMQRNDL